MPASTTILMDHRSYSPFGNFGGFALTTASFGAGIFAPPLAVKSGNGCAFGPPHGPGACTGGLGLGAGGCTIVLPREGGTGRANVACTRPANEAEVSTRGMP